MIFIVNFDMSREEINNIMSSTFENIIIDCLFYTGKKRKFFIVDSISSSSYSSFTKSKKQFIVLNVNIIKNDTLDVIFKNNNKLIYLINVSHKQEKYIYKKYKGKYQYFKCKFDPNKDNFLLYLKKLIFMKDNRMKLIENNDIQNIRYVLKFISYNIPYTDLGSDDMIENLEFLMDLDKYCFRIDKANILKLLISLFIVPTFGYDVSFPPKSKTVKKSKKPKKLTQDEIRELSYDLMPDYYKNRNKIFMNRTNDIGGGLL